ncbi:hypothetical protein COT75_03310 [Candidatus Beckwithbacteria bacterium CG10_big_fil_rev_8_21_14_0_10_34_10]|uniref:Uncharacterized protein n=1 Tax=Candidatus Beckwithbacteria bacterium CG10_big_fil_rev_8_21_14_0_10_34_10 TaxID=1974495 RepID=A0A2H0W8S9_9BACT|nr:MAG: hypothetical protein COT75_03310 [Candidatus Beckwithbacteria bacterium CG10_big_fil_rev_8_21_14_0_10_34_10]
MAGINGGIGGIFVTEDGVNFTPAPIDPEKVEGSARFNRLDGSVEGVVFKGGNVLEYLEIDGEVVLRRERVDHAIEPQAEKPSPGRGIER